jgi:uncharacterized protein HemX
MFGSGMGKILIILLLVGAGVGYFKYTQDQMAQLNQEIAKKDFALKADEETIKKQNEAIEQQKKILEQTTKEYQAAREKVTDLEDKFTKNGRNLNEFATAKPDEVEIRANTATKKTFRCIEQTVNQGTPNEKDC